MIATGPRNRQARSMLARLALIFGSLLFVFLTGEVALRAVSVFDRENINSLLDPPPARGSEELKLADLLRPEIDPLIAFSLRPGLRGHFKGAPVEINSRGLRGPEIGPKPPGGVRIALLGDSHTFGWGVAWQDTFGERLAARLTEQANGREIEVLNLGVPGYNSVQEVRTFERWIDELSPDYAVIHYVGNDSQLPNFMYAPPDVFALRPSLMLEFLRSRFRALWRQGHRPVLLERAPRDEENRYRYAGREVPERYRALQGQENLRAAYDRLVALAAEHEMPVALLLDANDYERLLTGRQENVHAPAAQQLVAHWRALGLPVVDTQERVLSALRASGDPSASLWIGEDDPHPNARRHALIAEALMAELGTSMLAVGR